MKGRASEYSWRRVEGPRVDTGEVWPQLVLFRASASDPRNKLAIIESRTAPGIEDHIAECPAASGGRKLRTFKTLRGAIQWCERMIADAHFREAREVLRAERPISARR